MIDIKITFEGRPDSATLALLQGIHEGIKNLTRETRAESQAIVKEMDDLAAAVKKNQDVEASAVTLIQGISQQLKDAAGNPAAVEALAQSLSTAADSLAAAVVANTPAAPAA